MTSPSQAPASWRSTAFLGVHYDLHAGADDTELGRELDPKQLREQLELLGVDWVQCDAKGGPGYTSYPTEVGTPSPGIVRDALEIHRQVTREMGIPLVVHYMGIRNKLAATTHPEWARIDDKGNASDSEVCLNSAYAQELMIPQMLDIIDRYDVDGFWVDGDLWFAALCWCPRCLEMFAATTGHAIADPPRSPSDARWNDWLRFHRRSYLTHVRRYVDAIHERKPGCLVCTNFAYLSVQPEDPDLALDWLSGDMPHAFPIDLVAFQARVLGVRDLPWDLIPWAFTVPPARAVPPWPPSLPIKPAAQLCQESSIILASGGTLCFYMQPQRTGFLSTYQHRVMAQVTKFCRQRQLINAATRSLPQVAVLNSAYHLYGAARGRTPLPHQTFGGGGVGPPNPVQGAVLALLDLHCHVDVLGDAQLLDRLDEYAMVVVPEQRGLAPDLVERLQQYVRAGGRLLVSGAHVAAEMPTLIGCVPRQAELPVQAYLATADAVALVKGPWQAVAPTAARVVFPLLREQELGKDETGWPAVTVHELDEGRVAAIHGAVFEEYMSFHSNDLRKIIGSVCAELDPPLVLHVDAPPSVHVSVRTGAGRTVVHLVNLAAETQMSPRRPEVEAVPAVGPVRLRLASQVPTAVELVPDGEITWDYVDGKVRIEVAEVGIHAAVVLTGSPS